MAKFAKGKKSMLTVAQIIEFLTQMLAEDRLQGDKVGLKHVQTTAGLLQAAAEAAGDKDTAYKFRLLAAQAANKQESLEKD